MSPVNGHNRMRTHMSDLQVTINGQAFPHLLYHLVLTYSNVEAVRVCLGETFEALARSVSSRRCGRSAVSLLNTAPTI